MLSVNKWYFAIHILQKLTLKVSALFTDIHLEHQSTKKAITFYWCKFYMKENILFKLLHVIYRCVNKLNHVRSITTDSTIYYTFQ